jgi:transposase InsO family protein
MQGRASSTNERLPSFTKPEIHHSDQGVHYAAKEDVELLQTHALEISMAIEEGLLREPVHM